jgi:hypothetical protein
MPKLLRENKPNPCHLPAGIDLYGGGGGVHICAGGISLYLKGTKL